MALHRLTRVTIGVPNVAETAQYYTEFGLGRLPGGDGDHASFSTGDGGEQFRLTHSPRRRLVEMRVGADDPAEAVRALRESAKKAGADAWWASH